MKKIITTKYQFVRRQSTANVGIIWNQQCMPTAQNLV